jgi:leader peptidase (prepilin peptidase) / N-methyltransferase
LPQAPSRKCLIPDILPISPQKKMQPCQDTPAEAQTYTAAVTAIWFEVLGFGLGLLFGSFLNVCISRLPEHESVVRPGSRCRSCGHAVRWFDNVPVLSWVVLRGKCRDCGAGISWRYPAVELGVGVWFAIVGYGLSRALWLRGALEALKASYPGTPPHDFFSLSLSDPALLTAVLAFSILGFLLIGLLVMDWQTMRLPDAFTLTGIAIGFVLVCVRAMFLAPGEGDIVLNTTHQLRMSSPGSFQAQGNVFLTGTEAMVLGRVAAICGAALILLVVRWGYKALRKRDGMGMGDVKLLAMIAAFLGFWEAVLALFVGVVAASVYGIVLIVRGKPAGTTKLPLGSFLAAGGLVAALFGARVVEWYAGLLR